MWQIPQCWRNSISNGTATDEHLQISGSACVICFVVGIISVNTFSWCHYVKYIIENIVVYCLQSGIGLRKSGWNRRLQKLHKETTNSACLSLSGKNLCFSIKSSWNNSLIICFRMISGNVFAANLRIQTIQNANKPNQPTLKSEGGPGYKLKWHDYWKAQLMRNIGPKLLRTF